MEEEVLFDYLTLGDGDFTFSLDLCRFMYADAAIQSILQQQNLHKEPNNSNEKDNISSSHSSSNRHYKIVCTGIDSLQELEHKYHDANFTLKKIKSLNNNHYDDSNHNHANGIKIKTPSSPDSPNISVSIHHCVNAIIVPTLPSNQLQQLQPTPSLPTKCRFKHVIFNHPHLGIEDASKHTKFLSHFFHSAHNYWLCSSRSRESNQDNNTRNGTGGDDGGGVVHLTLVKGQFERWNCLHVATEQGFVLLNRFEFKLPLPPGQYVEQKVKELENSSSLSLSLPSNLSNNIKTLFQSKDDFQNRFQHRRHQSGRSFASRAEGGSEIFTFGRILDNGCYVALYLPWQHMKLNTDNLVGSNIHERNEMNDSNATKNEMFTCPHCHKSFRDNRARKNHIKCVHGVQDDKHSSSSLFINGNQNKKQCLFCNLCQDEKSRKRQFPNEEALQSHKLAKHLGKYKDIKPDWAESNKLKEKNKSSGIDNMNAYGRCNICNFTLVTKDDEISHWREFIPTTTMDESLSIRYKFHCGYCNKKFNDKRAQLQHENFCAFITNHLPLKTK